MRIALYWDVERAEARYAFIEDAMLISAIGDPIRGFVRGSTVGPLAGTRLLPPVTPSKIVCVGLNYRAHVTENDPTRTIPDEPVIFMKPASAIIGPGDAIEIAYPAHRTDYEAELAVVIGRRARRVPERDALDYVFGYTAANDVTDRDLQKKDGQWVRAKGFDTYCPLGPWIETHIDLGSATVESRLNGQVKQSQTTAAMIFRVSFLVSFVSHVMTLEPGDVLLTGTPEGVGPMQAGDVIEVEICGIGVMRNLVTNRPGAIRQGA